MLPVKDHNIKKEMKISELVKQMKKSGGFTSKKLAIGVDIISDMMKKSKLNFLSFPACIVATGTRGIIRDMVKKKMFQCVITACGTLDHDIARSFEDYYHGDFMMDDADLRKRGMSRLGNILIPSKSYGIIIEKKMQQWLPDIFANNAELATYEFCWEIGKKLGKENKKDSILYWAWKNKIPIIVPGITDGAVGYQLWQHWQYPSAQHNRKIEINVLKDEQLLSDMIWNTKKEKKKSSALILGGGISKHHTIWWNQFGGGLDYAVYISTAAEFDGSLSGARPREAISWGKLNARAKHVHIEGDVTIVLPLIYTALLDRIKG